MHIQGHADIYSEAALITLVYSTYKRITYSNALYISQCISNIPVIGTFHCELHVSQFIVYPSVLYISLCIEFIHSGMLGGLHTFMCIAFIHAGMSGELGTSQYCVYTFGEAWRLTVGDAWRSVHDPLNCVSALSNVH